MGPSLQLHLKALTAEHSSSVATDVCPESTETICDNSTDLSAGTCLNALFKVDTPTATDIGGSVGWSTIDNNTFWEEKRCIAFHELSRLSQIHRQNVL